MHHCIKQTNDIYHEAFLQWAQEFPNVKVINDGTTKNEVSIVKCTLVLLLHYTFCISFY